MYQGNEYTHVISNANPPVGGLAFVIDLNLIFVICHLLSIVLNLSISI